MDYEKKYNEALEQAKGYMDAGSSDLTDVLPEIFPELRESEDEKIRKDIIGGLMWQRDNLKSEGPHNNNLILPGFCLNVGKHLTYLEKQKDTNCLACDQHLKGYLAGRKATEEEKQKEQKPVEWSEEDEKIKERLITRLNWITYNTRTDGTSPNITFFDEIAWLKSLRPQPHWKPSEEQMTMLRAVLNDPNNAGAESCQLALSGLYEQLKKL